MNKLVLSMVMVAVVVIALGTAGFVYAQAPTPQTPVPGTGYGYGMMGGGRGARGGMTLAPAPRAGVGGQIAAAGTQDGLLHDEMIAAYAQKLGISVADLNTRLANGETMAQIASSKGLTSDQFFTLMKDARNQAIDQAVKNGTLTQVQADWMKLHGAGQMAGGQMGAGRGMRSMRGAGQGLNANADCPYYQTNP